MEDMVSYFFVTTLLASLPLYLIVAKFNPTKLGSRKLSLPASHVPSPTCIVAELYELLPGGASCGEGDMMLLLQSIVPTGASMEGILPLKELSHHAGITWVRDAQLFLSMPLRNPASHSLARAL